jgi:mono/diheme cytochrome c family protein
MSRLTALTLLALASCALVAARSGNSADSALPPAKAAKGPVLSQPAGRGLAFAQAHCAGCHGVTAGSLSPNPESPPFEAIVNAPDLTGATLRQFLRDSHNFPQAMNFTVSPASIDDLADYMLTLRTPTYRPAI